MINLLSGVRFSGVTFSKIQDFGVGGLIWHDFGICRVRAEYVFVGSWAWGRRRLACDGSLCFYGCGRGRELVLLGTYGIGTI